MNKIAYGSNKTNQNLKTKMTHTNVYYHKTKMTLYINQSINQSKHICKTP